MGEGGNRRFPTKLKYLSGSGVIAQKANRT